MSALSVLDAVAAGTVMSACSVVTRCPPALTRACVTYDRPWIVRDSMLVACMLNSSAPPETLRLNNGVRHLFPSSLLPHNGSYIVSPVVEAAVGTAQTSDESGLSPTAFTAVTAANTGVPLVSADSVAPVAVTLILVPAVV